LKTVTQELVILERRYGATWNFGFGMIESKRDAWGFRLRRHHYGSCSAAKVRHHLAGLIPFASEEIFGSRKETVSDADEMLVRLARNLKTDCVSSTVRRVETAKLTALMVVYHPAGISTFRTAFLAYCVGRGIILQEKRNGSRTWPAAYMVRHNSAIDNEFC
jgi:hypothetical protein